MKAQLYRTGAYFHIYPVILGLFLPCFVLLTSEASALLNNFQICAGSLQKGSTAFQIERDDSDLPTENYLNLCVVLKRRPRSEIWMVCPTTTPTQTRGGLWRVPGVPKTLANFANHRTLH